MINILRSASYWQNTRPVLGAVVDWSHPLARDLVFEMPFLEGAGSQARDLAGGNHGRLLGGLKMDPGGAVGNGTSSYVNCGSPSNGSLDFSGSFTVSASFVTQTLDASRGVFNKGAPSNTTGKGYQLTVLTSGHLYCYLGDGVNGNKYAVVAESKSIVKASKVSSLSVLYKYNGDDWGNTEVYSHGKKSGLASSTLNLVTGGVADSANSLLVGSRNAAYGWWNGIIYFVRIHSRSLDPGEVQSLAQNPWQFYRAPIRRAWFPPLLFSIEQAPVITGNPVPFHIRFSASRSALRAPELRSSFRVPVAQSNFILK